VQDQLAQHVHQDMVVVVLQMMTRLQLSHEADELGTDSCIGLVIFDDSSDRNGRRLNFPLLRQSISRGQRRLRGPLRLKLAVATLGSVGAGGTVAEFREHLDRADPDENRCCIFGLAVPNKINGQLAQPAGNILDCVPHRAGA
jgi:hypothetical protein